MQRTYAVMWEENGGPPAAGRLELGPEGLMFEGARGHDPVVQRVPYEDVASVTIGRRSSERIDGRQTLVVERREDDPIRVASVAGHWIVAELAERLAAVYTEQRGSLNRLVVVVPIRKDARAAARELIERGPPFDPCAAGLERHLVFLGEHEVVFVFEARTRAALEQLFGSAGMLASAESWGDVVAGPASIAAEAYTWEREPANGASEA